MQAQARAGTLTRGGRAPRPAAARIAPAALLLFTAIVGRAAGGEGPDPAKPYLEGIRKVNQDHARKPGKNRESDLAKLLPKPARAGLERLLEAKDSPAVLEALFACGEAALDLDLMADFDRVRARLEKSSPEHARRLGTALSCPRFLLRGVGGLSPGYLERFAEVLEAILQAYDEVFGFEEWSKVPGKKIRVRIHLEEKITRPPHFAPQFPFHSEIDFPVADASAFRSPTADGKFLFYGLCHELGHLIAMWGDGTGKEDEDHHAWAHYTGLAIVEHLSRQAKDRPALEDLNDARWRSLERERKELEAKRPALADREGVLALLFALHDRPGPKALGQAINQLDRQDRRRRINKVRYYTFRELKGALLLAAKNAEEKKAVASLIPDAPAR